MTSPKDINARNRAFWKRQSQEFEAISKHDPDIIKAAADELNSEIAPYGMAGSLESVAAKLHKATSANRNYQTGKAVIDAANKGAAHSIAEADERANKFVSAVQERLKRNPNLTPGQACDKEANAQGIGKSTGRRYWERLFPKSPD